MITSQTVRPLFGGVVEKIVEMNPDSNTYAVHVRTGPMSKDIYTRVTTVMVVEGQAVEPADVLGYREQEASE